MANFLWYQIELPAVEEDACAIVCKGTESSCLRLDRLDAAVEALAHGVGNSVAKVSERIFEVFFKHFGYFDDRWELTSCCPSVPRIEKLASISCIGPKTHGQGPKPTKLFLDCPSP